MEYDEECKITESEVRFGIDNYLAIVTPQDVVITDTNIRHVLNSNLHRDKSLPLKLRNSRISIDKNKNDVHYFITFPTHRVYCEILFDAKNFTLVRSFYPMRGFRL